MSYFAYILRSTTTGRFYYGHVEDVNERLTYHNSGRVTSTRKRGPWEIFHCEEFATRAEAASANGSAPRILAGLSRWFERPDEIGKVDRSTRSRPTISSLQ